ncbi:DUF4257 domain-containing protein [Cytobacillus firmus]|jgi:hypothetical protein|uniref:DUF4257 domain-containing protein n=5 Tax=Cytobacillus TaxID=2675230 RepID=A0A0J5W3D1_CYTFI|nr:MULTISPECIES: DUF4257 domain-containing protein [Bacillales]EFV79699.1 hypothetical protein HMPREF1013_00147 [Bacillus sp. 2_A_57_CT2]KAF0817532.1 hypothetical protein KIS4809_3585 [Bacillus sp. ZZV12-4809]MDM5226101.1 DUF4257 domain-containing protein [Cytobacillus sp. NJ13]AND39514.1 hypothetical protein A361_10345 [Cytobacillus oceanisediminis 2691]EWG10411.1 hypothetical protein PBF_14949 [Cytobacillus firmus DS1]
MFLNITFALLIGGLVGVVGHIRKEGKMVKPRRTKKFIYLGVFEEVIMGALAAVFLVVSSDPDSALKVVLLAVIAGFGGDALLTCLDFLKIRHKE